MSDEDKKSSSDPPSGPKKVKVEDESLDSPSDLAASASKRRRLAPVRKGMSRLATFLASHRQRSAAGSDLSQPGARNGEESDAGSVYQPGAQRGERSPPFMLPAAAAAAAGPRSCVIHPRPPARISSRGTGPRCSDRIMLPAAPVPRPKMRSCVIHPRASRPGVVAAAAVAAVPVAAAPVVPAAQPAPVPGAQPATCMHGFTAISEIGDSFMHGYMYWKDGSAPDHATRARVKEAAGKAVLRFVDSVLRGNHFFHAAPVAPAAPAAPAPAAPVAAAAPAASAPVAAPLPPAVVNQAPLKAVCRLVPDPYNPPVGTNAGYFFTAVQRFTAPLVYGFLYRNSPRGLEAARHYIDRVRAGGNPDSERAKLAIEAGVAECAALEFAQVRAAAAANAAAQRRAAAFVRDRLRPRVDGVVPAAQPASRVTRSGRKFGPTDPSL